MESLEPNAEVFTKLVFESICTGLWSSPKEYVRFLITFGTISKFPNFRLISSREASRSSLFTLTRWLNILLGEVQSWRVLVRARVCPCVHVRAGVRLMFVCLHLFRCFACVACEMLDKPTTKPTIRLPQPLRAPIPGHTL